MVALKRYRGDVDRRSLFRKQERRGGIERAPSPVVPQEPPQESRNAVVALKPFGSWLSLC